VSKDTAISPKHTQRDNARLRVFQAASTHCQDLPTLPCVIGLSASQDERSNLIKHCIQNSDATVIRLPAILSDHFLFLQNVDFSNNHERSALQIKPSADFSDFQSLLPCASGVTMISSLAKTRIWCLTDLSLQRLCFKVQLHHRSNNRIVKQIDRII